MSPLFRVLLVAYRPALAFGQAERIFHFSHLLTHDELRARVWMALNILDLREDETG